MMKAKKKKMKSKQKAKAKKSTKAKKAVKTMTRLKAAVIALGQMKVGGKVKYESAVQRADNIYAGQANGGKSNLKESTYAMNKATTVLSLIGLITVKGGAITCLKKVK